MLRLTFDDLAKAFRTHRSAFHLETRDDYLGVPGESEEMHRFYDGHPPDPAFGEVWQALMREVTGEGCQVRRVRVISEPWGEYTRFSLGTTYANMEAGEDIRWLPRHDAPPDLPADDWWLFDDQLAAFTVFDHDGTAEPGWVATTDPVITKHYAARREELWSRAISHYEYAK
ncbi:DUF6879 family protein [Nocardia terpenica]|uniref:DUF6879 domain-containing protein n=1 Tax=Nocardia terpenica TaxID=455432 RepID=A0A291RCJ9_9NOCA|nr:DUF6879 family protein [Nocardia terpenica]ATL65047.1 hypothetical protein CRH09_01185 [Nocardia terpenica]